MFITFAVLLSAGLCLAETDQDGEMVLTVEHSFDVGESWEARGTVNVHSTKSTSFSIDQQELSRSQKSQLDELCARGALYLVRVRAQSGLANLGLHRTYAHACNLLQANLVDQLTLHLDWRNNLVAVSMKTEHQSRPSLSSPEAVAFEQKSQHNNLSFRTRVTSQNMEAGPVPDTAAFIQRMEQEKADKQKGGEKDNRSFFAKYWMYILPVIVFMAMSSGNAPEGGNR